jgi:hypothetical protein
MKRSRSLRMLAPLTAGLVLLHVGSEGRPAEATLGTPPSMRGAWLGITRSDADPTRFRIREMVVTRQERCVFTGRLTPNLPPTRLVTGEIPPSPELTPAGPEPHLSLAGTVANGRWAALAHRGGRQVTLLGGRLSSFQDGPLFSEGELLTLGTEADRADLALLQSFAVPVGSPPAPAVAGMHGGQAQFGSVDDPGNETVAVRLAVGALGQQGNRFAAAGLFGDAPFLLVGTLVPPNPVQPVDPCRMLLLGPNLNGTVEGSYSTDGDGRVVELAGRFVVEDGSGRRAGTLALAPSH